MTRRSGLLMALAVALVACGPAPTPTPSTYSIDGAFLLQQNDRTEQEVSGDTVIGCSGTGGYGDIGQGVQVVVRDGEGSVLGSGELALDPDDPAPNLHACRYVFEIDGLPETAFYAIEVGDRGELTYSLAEMEEMDWRVVGQLGD